MQAVEVLHTALREYFLYGRERFERQREMFLEVVEEADLGPYLFRDFPTWDQLKAEYFCN
jgi:hypothetical protein